MDSQKVQLKKIWIQNFKSLHNVEVDINKFNLIIGKNASGKSNFIELFSLLKKIYSKSYNINPFLEWWGYQNVVWMKDESLPIILKFHFKAYNLDIYYEVAFTGQFGDFKFLSEKMDIPNILKIERIGNVIKIYNYPEFLNSNKENILSYIKTVYADPSFNYDNNGITESIDDTENIFDFIRSHFPLSIGFNKMELYSIPLKKGYFAFSQLKEWHEKLTPEAEYFIDVSFFGLLHEIRQFFNNILILKSIDPQTIKKSIRVTKKEYNLSMDASNLQSILYNIFLKNNKIPDEILNSIEYIFGDNVAIRFNLTDDARVFISMIENNEELSPPMISDGFFKALAILCAIYLKPSILLIDEIENSLHPNAIERIFDDLYNTSFPVIISTHSTALIDIVKPHDVIIFEKTNFDTIVRRIKNPDKLMNELKENGLTFSEGWLFGNI